MASTYYDSQLTAAEIEAALEAIDGLIVPANNGKIVAVEDGTLTAKYVTDYFSTLETLTVTEDGTYTPSAGKLGFSQVTVAVDQGGSGTATASDILSGKTAMVNGAMVTGSMANNGAVAGVIDADTTSYTIPAGYHNGSGTVSADVATTSEVLAYLGLTA